MLRILAAALAGFISAGATMAEAAEPPDNDAYFSLIRTEPGQLPPIGWTRLPTPRDLATVPRDGFFADAFFEDDTRQIVIAFRRLNPIPFVNAGTYDADAAILHGLPLPGYEADLKAFVAAVIVAATEQTPPLSTGQDNTFVTGNSLGAYGAQLAAQAFHYGGVGFAGPGLPGYRSPPDRAGNFVNYLIQGDPIANHAADTGISWIGWPSAAGVGDHYGRIERLGRPGDQLALQVAVSLAAAPPVSPIADLLGTAGDLGLAIEIGLKHMSPRYKAMLHIETLPQQKSPEPATP
jgi:hypothetical protein